jgi:hypothetical protein
MSGQMTRRLFAKLSSAAAGFAAAPILAAGTAAGSVSAPEDDQLHSEFLLHIVIETGPVHPIGSAGLTRAVVPVAGGTFEGPKLKGSIVGPGGDWIVGRPDGSSLLDVRLMLRTDDGQDIYMSWRGINYTPSGGSQYARIVPAFETGAAKYLWLNDIVAVGVYRPTPGKVAYRVYQIL